MLHKNASEAKYCEFWTGYAGVCGIPLTGDQTRCNYHQKKTEPVRRKKIGPYSGDSRWRQEQGMYQAKRGR